MKEIKLKTIEEALSTYKGTVSPSRNTLVNILNQIPEKELSTKQDDRRAIRSPYRWQVFVSLVPALIVLFLIYPQSGVQNPYATDSFYSIDKQIDEFEANMTEEDYQNLLKDYTL
jgi:hypothetical protein